VRQPALALLHSALTSAAAWGEFPDALRRQGHTVFVPEILDDNLPPFAQRYVARAAVQLAADAPGLPLLLVGHGDAGPLLPQLAFARHAAGAPVFGYLFLDALLPRVPRATTRLELLALTEPGAAESLRRALRSGRRFPDWTEADLATAIPDSGQRTVLLAGLRPRALDFFTEPLPMPEDWPDAPCAYLRLSPTYARAAATARHRDWRVRELNLHHFAALTHPHELAEALSQLTPHL